MNAPSNSVYAIVAAFSIAMAACQPSEGPLESQGRDTDRAAKQVGDPADKAGAKKTSRQALNP